MNIAVAHRLTVADAARILREAVKDKSYRAFPLGQEVGRYVRWKRNEWGATDETIRDYETALARLAIYHPETELAGFEPPYGTDRLRDCWDHHWGNRAARTRAKIRSIWVDFFDWAVNERKMVGNPARALATPKKRDVERKTFTQEFVQRVIASQPYLPDRLGCWLILMYGLRRGGLANVQMKHFDFERQELTVFTKGGRVYPLPIVDDEFWRDLGAAQLEQRLGPDDYLINWRTDTRRRRVPIEEAEEVLDLSNGQQQGYAWVATRHHAKRPTGKRMHLWWYRCLERAGIVDKGVTAGQNMHRGRHTAITEVLRGTGNLELARMLAGHKDIRTTQTYAHLDTTDLHAALRAMRGEQDDA